MSKKLLFFLLVLSQSVTAQIVNIPDANFKAVLVADITINTNGDGEIQVSEASAFTGTMDLMAKFITDLTGIEAFTALTWLDCTYNFITSLDVSTCTALTTLYCFENSLTSLDVSNNTALITLSCSGNLLTSLDVRNGNNVNFTNFNATDNFNLYCISVDDTTWSNVNWSTSKDIGAIYSNDCMTVDIEDQEPNQPTITTNNAAITFVGKGTATIYNLKGQIVHQSRLTGRNTISLEKGIYLVRVTDGNKGITKKVYLN
ncbi:MAG: T9SS type A sorting domain-containing protein [Bacteroidetes bacterium]|nr:T9SS type A sorting domain-containing protein [Bacteroidota bacterium]